MALRPEDQDFLRFQQEGSPEALARVFDVVAPQLLLLAGHLARDAAQAEDLVQTTFLHAMRDADRYDGQRPVAAWLAGILRHRALDALRRQRAHTSEDLSHATLSDTASGTSVTSPKDPADLASDKELFERVHQTVDRLEEPYRQVLLLRVVHGLEPTAIAHTLGRPPGTVRMQLSRGLERLRRTMPNESALLGALFVSPTSGLSGVRETVLAKASAVATAGAGAVATATVGTNAALQGGLLGGILSMKVLGTIVVGALAALAMYTMRGGETSANEETRAPESGIVVTDPTRTVDDELNPPEDVGATVAAAREPMQEDVASPTALTTDLEVTVRYERDGSVARDIGVYVRGAQEASLGFDARTDKDGHVTFPELTPGSYTVHVDRNETLSKVDTRETSNTTILIPSGVRVEGRILDLEENGVSGALVYRFNETHHDLLQKVGVSDADGRFVLEDVAEGTELIARISGFQPSELERVRVRDGETAEVELVLGARGHLLTGRVVDSEGRPSPLAWIAIGVDEDAREELEGSSAVPGDGSRRKPLDREAFFLRADEEGRFESDEVPAGHAIVIARPLDEKSDALGFEPVWVRPGSDADVTITLFSGAEIVGTVRDVDGRPAQGMRLEAEWEGTPALGQMEDDLGPAMSDRIVLSSPDGTFRFGGLLPGDYDLRVLGERQELLQESAMVEPGASLRWDPIIPTFGAIHARLLDPEGEPIEGWVLASSIGKDHGSQYSFFGTETDVDGRRVLRELETGATYTVRVFAPSAEDTFHSLPVALRREVQPSEKEVVIRLLPEEMPTCNLSGRWMTENGPASEGRIRIIRDGWDASFLLRTDAEGAFAIDALPSGKYRVYSGWNRDSGHVEEELLGEWVLAPGDRVDTGDVSVP